jgi:hypothetical protein
MQSNGFLRFHRAAEAAGYPAMLIVSAWALAMVVALVSLLALTQAGWTLALAVLSIPAALGLVAGSINAALADGEYPEPSFPAAELGGTERETVVALKKRAIARSPQSERRAA